MSEISFWWQEYLIIIMFIFMTWMFFFNTMVSNVKMTWEAQTDYYKNRVTRTLILLQLLHQHSFLSVLLGLKTEAFGLIWSSAFSLSIAAHLVLRHQWGGFLTWAVLRCTKPLYVLLKICLLWVLFLSFATFLST